MAVSLFALGVLAAGLPMIARAQGVDLGIEYGTSLGLTTQDIRTTIGAIINAFLGLLGLVAVVLIVYAGYLWMTAGGEEDKITTAKQIMTNAAIGLAIILAAFAIVQFIFRALNIPTGIGGSSSGPQSGVLGGYTSGVSSALGAGIIEYHYPENGQTDVPRNTSIIVTFKRPLVLSTVFKNYDDKGTFDTSDDVVPATLELNTDTVKVIQNQRLQGGGQGSADEQFASRYADAVTDPAPLADVTDVAYPYIEDDGQTLVVRPAAWLGSASTDVTYRVAFKGGDRGVEVWAPDPAGAAEPVREEAFPNMTQDGGYFWSFATGTVVDTTPPMITSVVPRLRPSPGSAPIDRNQLLQIWFNEGVDPTTASGFLGSGGGFTNILIQARCLPGLPCVWNGGETDTFTTIDGTLRLGNKYRTAEFTPELLCEGVTANSCGEPVYCLPKNVEIRAVARAATISAEPPTAAARDGVVDLANNSLDGNGNGTAQGPLVSGLAEDYFMNAPPSTLAGISDTAYWMHHTGERIDLVPPVVISIDPVSPPPTDAVYPEGPSKVGVLTPITVRWSKVMSIGSIRTGMFDESTGAWADTRTTLAIRSKECAKNDPKQDCAADGYCPCTDLDPPSYFVDSGTGPVDNGGTDVTEMKIVHRTFFTADELGYTEQDRAAFPEIIPVYQPVIRARIKDAKQNCFFPSQGYQCPDGGEANPSCCNRATVAGDRYVCPF